MNMILIGAQGSGKGTQAKMLAEHYGFKHLSTGDLYRKKVAEGDPVALQMKEYSDKGELVPDELVIELVKNNLSETGNILDGVPRTLEQAKILDEMIEIALVIELELSDEEAVKRISTRKTCRTCGAVYGLEKKPEIEGVCDKCGGKLYQRNDDKEEAVRKRLAIYHDMTEPLLEYYRPRDIVRKVKAEQPIDEIFRELCKIVDSELLITSASHFKSSAE